MLLCSEAELARTARALGQPSLPLVTAVPGSDLFATRYRAVRRPVGKRPLLTPAAINTGLWRCRRIFRQMRAAYRLPEPGIALPVDSADRDVRG
jgi:hypothetical protein